MASASTSGTGKVFQRLGLGNLFQKMSDGSNSESTSTLNDIYAFRTMTTLLSALNHLRPNSMPVIQPPSLSDKQAHELKVLTALATVLVMEHEKVAVVTKHGDGGSEEVFACTDNITVDENTKSFPTDILENLWNFVVAENPRKKLKHQEFYPTIHNPKDSPDHPIDVTLDKLKAHVKKNWR